MDAHAVIGRHVIPAQLGAADQFSNAGQLVVAGAGLRGGGNVEIGLGQGGFRPAAGLMDLVLNAFHAAAQLLLAPAMADGDELATLASGLWM